MRDKRGMEYEHMMHQTMSGDAGAIACQNIMLMAYALGVGSCWLYWFDPQKIKQWFDITKTLDVSGIICLRYPKYWPKAPEWTLSTDPKLYPRRPLEDLVDYEKVDTNKW